MSTSYNHVKKQTQLEHIKEKLRLQMELWDKEREQTDLLLAERNSTIKSLQDEVQVLKQSLLKAEKDSEHWRCEKEQSSQELKQLAAEQQKVLHELSSAHQDNANELKTRIDQLNLRVKDQDMQVVQLQQDLHHKDGVIAELTSKCQMYADRENHLQSEMQSTLRGQFLEMENRKESQWRQEKAKYQNLIKSLKEANEKLDRDNKAIQETHQAEIRVLQESNRIQLESVKRDYDFEKEKSQYRINSYRADLEQQIAEEVAAIEQEFEQHLQDQLERERISMNQKIVELQTKIAQLSDQCQNQKNIIKEKNEQQKVMEVYYENLYAKKLKQMDIKLNFQLEENRRLSQSLVMQQNDKDDFLVHLSDQLEAKDALIYQLQNRLASIEDGKGEQPYSSTGTINELKSRIKQKDSAIQSMKSKLLQSEAENKLRTTVMDDLKENLQRQSLADYSYQSAQRQRVHDVHHQQFDTSVMSTQYSPSDARKKSQLKELQDQLDLEIQRQEERIQLLQSARRSPHTK
ncbi:hypothetical protein MIR68_007255 [Amoeboaphelidium protococcarum]|nr:hypothetical protein MIR68_007255 [Amoeboaphelidium protococcarum]